MVGPVDECGKLKDERKSMLKEVEKLSEVLKGRKIGPQTGSTLRTIMRPAMTFDGSTPNTKSTKNTCG